MDPRGTAGSINKEDHYALLHTKYDSSGPCGFEEEDFLCLSHCKSLEITTPGLRPYLNPGPKLHLTMLHTKYRSFGSCVFPCFSHNKPMADNGAPGLRSV